MRFWDQSLVSTMRFIRATKISAKNCSKSVIKQRVSQEIILFALSDEWPKRGTKYSAYMGVKCSFDGYAL